LATKRSFDTLSTLLAQLGPPPERHRRDVVPVTLNTAPNIHQYHEFMRKNRGRGNDNILKDTVFYEGGLSKERRPVFYFVMRKLSLDNLDLETVMYRVFLVSFAACVIGIFSHAMCRPNALDCFYFNQLTHSLLTPMLIGGSC